MPSRTRRTLLLVLPLFLSGFCGISYEVLYARLLAGVVGSHFTVNAAILVTFLLGIAIGTRGAHRFARHLYAIEWLIGAYAIGFALALPGVDRLIFTSTLAQSLGVQVAAVCLLLIVPSTCVGATLPLFSALLKPLVASRAFGLAYMVYNFGAALTALAIEFVLIRRYGIHATLIGIAGLNFLAGALLFASRNSLAAAPEPPRPGPPCPPRILAALVAVSFGSAVFQLFMLKLVQFVYGPFNETFAMVLFVVLLGIALGSVASRLLRWSFATFALLAIVSLALLLVVEKPLLFLYADSQQDFAAWGLITLRICLVLLLAGPAAICFGAAIPALMNRESHVAHESGLLLSVSSLANAAGFLAMVLFIHENFTYGQTIVLVAALLGLAWVLSCPGRPVVAAVGPLLVLGLIPLLRHVWVEDLLYGSHTDFSDLATLQAKLAGARGGERFRKHDEVLAVRDVDGDRIFNLNGYYSISSKYLSEHVVGLMSVLVSPRLDDALVLGLGTGSTAGSVAEYFKHSDIVEISQLVVDHQELFKDNSYDLAAKKNVAVHCDDGIRFLKRSAATYDLVLNTVTNPRYFSSSKLYTADFLRLVKSRLAPDGVYTTWIGSSVGNRGLGIIVRTLKANFKHCWIGSIHSDYWLLLCSDTPLELHQDGSLEKNDRVRAYFARQGRDVEGVRYSMLSDNAFGILDQVGDVPLNTLDRPTLEFEMARLARSSDPTQALLQSYVFDRYDPDRLNRTIFKNRPIDPVALALYYSQIKRADSDTATKFFTNLGSLHDPDFRRKLDEKRLGAYAKMAREFPRADTMLHYGRELMLQNRFDEAVEILRKCLAIDPQTDNANLDLGESFFEKGNYAEAERYLKQELVVDPDDRAARALLAKIAELAPAK
jgi:spermidine synthase